MKRLLLIANVILLLSASASAQFVDRIVRPCPSGSPTQASVIVNPSSSGDVKVTTCSGGTLDVNGVPVTPGPVAPVSAAYIVRTPNATLTNESAISLLATGILFGTITTGVISSLGPDLPFANLTQATAASKLLGRGSAAGAGDFQELTLGTNLSMSGTTLNAASGITGSGTAGTLPYFSAATVLADSPFTRPSATHVQLFANAPGGFDFDSSAPSINLNGTGAPVTIGGATKVTIDDGAPHTITLDGATINIGVGASAPGVAITGVNANGGIALTVNAAGAEFGNLAAEQSTIGDWQGNGNNTKITISDSAQTITQSAGTESTAINGVAHTITNAAATSIANVTPSWGAGGSGLEFEIDNNGEITTYGTDTAPDDGFLLIGNGSSFQEGPLTPGAGINIANAPGSITISTNGLSGTSASIGGGLLAAGACASTATTVTGAAVGMATVATPNTDPGVGNFWQSYVSAANTVTVRVCAAVAGTPTASTFNVRVIQ